MPMPIPPGILRPPIEAKDPRLDQKPGLLTGIFFVGRSAAQRRLPIDSVWVVAPRFSCPR
jgi:hypothetical protein